MSDYGIFVNADGDDIEEAEEQLRDSIDFDIDFDFEAAEAERRMLQEEPTRSANALDAAGNSRCIKDKDRVESTKGDTESKFDRTRWYCWTTCDDAEATKMDDPAKCPPQYILWPPSFCKKGTEDCVGPYMKRTLWEINESYNDKEKAVGENVPYKANTATYEVGYNWTKAKKFRNMMLQT